MSEGEQPVVYHPEPQSHVAQWVLIALAVAYVAASAYFIYAQRLELQKLTEDQTSSEKQIGDLTKRMQTAESDSETLARQLGMTKKELATRAIEFQRQQQAAAASLAKQAQEEKNDINAVAGEVGSVKTDVGGVKTDVAKTQSDLATAVTQLTSMRGDLNGHSSLIARNADELELLKHKGDRNYYEFTLVKGQKKPVGTVSLELKKADGKKSRYTLVVYSDDKQYEKKDRNLNEPLQFYSGKDPQLFEIVVNSVSAKNTVTGYLSTPKGAPAPPATGR